MGNYNCVCEDVTMKFYNEEYKGYRMGSICLEFMHDQGEPVKRAKVDAITLKVNDTEREITFKKPLELVPLSENANSGLVSLAQLSAGSGVGGEVTFAFEAIEDITLEGFSLGEYAELEDMVIGIDEGSKVNAEKVGGPECLPLTVKKGDSFVIQGIVKSNYFTGYQDIDTVSNVYYSADGKHYIEQHNLFLNAISDMEDVRACIDGLFEANIIQ